jgi:hypothetical protein
MVLRAHTEPAVNIPSKNIAGNQCISKYVVDNPPKHNERKNPTHVLVQSVQLIKSPKKLECSFILFLRFSNIDPHTKIDVIPYDIKIQNINISI